MFVLGWSVFFMVVMFGFERTKWLWIFVVPPLFIWCWLYDWIYFFFDIEVDFQIYPHYLIYGVSFIACGLLMAKRLHKPSLRVNFIVPEIVLPILLIPYDMFLLPWFWSLDADWQKIIARVTIHPLYMVWLYRPFS